jgi:hypothetical protein
LAHVNRFVERGTARVVLAIGKQQDEISAVCAIEGTELVETRAVDAVKNGCATVRLWPSALNLRMPAVSATASLVQGCTTPD